MSPDDVDAITSAFASRNKRREQYVRYFEEQHAGERVTLVAVSDRVIGIGVGLTPDYAAAQHLYPKLGYVPDGLGTHQTQ